MDNREIRSKAEAQKIKEHWRVMLSELQNILKIYSNKYNIEAAKNNESLLTFRIFEVKLDGSSFDDPQVKIGFSLGIEVVVDNLPSIPVIQFKYGAYTFNQLQNREDDAKLDLCRKLMYELVSGGLNSWMNTQNQEHAQS